MTDKLPSQAKAWQFSSVKGGLENNLQLNTIDIPKPKPNQHLIRVLALSLNPVDYKVAEAPLIGSLAVSKPAIPCIDVAGEIVKPAEGSDLKVGTIVCGIAAGQLAAAGAAAQYAVIATDQAVVVPETISASDAAALPIVGVTAYQALAPFTKAGDHVFYNGGSGGVGVFAIQIAKILGLHITVTCSTRNIGLCKSLGADEVIDYTVDDVVQTLSRQPYKFDHAVDGVGSDPALYFKAHLYTKPSAGFYGIAFAPTLSSISYICKAMLLPSFLGGGKRKMTTLASVPKAEDLQKIVAWVDERKLKVVIDSKYPLEQVPEAFRKSKTGRARGKIVIDVA